MRFLSLFSGIEAASVAWKPLGWECVAVSEIESFPCAVLAHHFPDVPNLGDVTKITETDIAALGQIDLVVFGSPCQDLSVAGKRAGFFGARSGLFHTAIDIILWARKHGGCRFALWENVPGAFSSNQGRDFAAVVGEMAGLRDVAVPANGWGAEGVALGDDGLLEWVVLDAQYFGVAQRRRRVFALADFGNWQDRGPILLERQSLRRDSPPIREAGQGFAADIAPSLTASGRAVERIGETRGQDPVIAQCLTTGTGQRYDAETETLLSVYAPIPFDTTQITSRTNRSNPQPGAPCHTLSQSADAPSIDFTNRGIHTGDIGETLRAESHGALPMVSSGLAVRRLTPIECERLQGFPDNYTLIPYRGKPAADSPRYKALGNSMAVPCMRWIGSRIDAATRRAIVRAAAEIGKTK